jgi:uroporphyrinogen decarboxylase
MRLKMDARTRIKNIFCRQPVDRAGVFDEILPQTKARWQKEEANFPQDLATYFAYDLQMFSLEEKINQREYLKAKKQKRFLLLSLDGPFEQFKKSIGYENALKAMLQRPKYVRTFFLQALKKIEKAYLCRKENHYFFDGICLREDLAYQKGLYFAPSVYKALLYPVHCQLVKFFKKDNLAIVFHSDGNILEIVEDLVRAGIEAIHPLDCASLETLRLLKRQYGRKLILFGSMPVALFQSNKRQMQREIRQRLKILSRCGYIYQAAAPILPDVKFKQYAYALKLVKKLSKN